MKSDLKAITTDVAEAYVRGRVDGVLAASEVGSWKWAVAKAYYFGCPMPDLNHFNKTGGREVWEPWTLADDLRVWGDVK